MLWQFRLTVAGAVTDAHADVLFERADDLTVEVHQDTAWVAFDRPAPTLADAVVSGVRDLDTAGLPIGAAIADDPLVTPDVIAERIGRRIRPGLLTPLTPGTPRPVYRWPDVETALGLDRADSSYEPTLEAVNLTLRIRELAPYLERLGPLRSLLHP